jgi:AcrR family transcriptional regulator
MKKEKARLDRAQVIETAMRVVDAEGLEALTIRRLAGELGVTPMALYWHFSDKQALLDGLVDQLWSDALALIAAAPVECDPWAGMRGAVLAMVESFSRHPTLAPMAPMRAIACEPGLTITERALEILHDAGLNPQRAAETARYMLSSAIMLVCSQPGAEIPDEEMREQITRSKKAGITALSPERYPRLIEAVEYLVICDEPEEYYRAGVDLIMGGVVAQVHALAHS